MDATAGQGGSEVALLRPSPSRQPTTASVVFHGAARTMAAAAFGRSAAEGVTQFAFALNRCGLVANMFEVVCACGNSIPVRAGHAGGIDLSLRASGARAAAQRPPADGGGCGPIDQTTTGAARLEGVVVWR